MSKEMPLLGGPMHGHSANDRRVIVAVVPHTRVAGRAYSSPFDTEPERGLYQPLTFAMCGRVVVVGIWEHLSETERDDLMWDLLASDAAKALGRRP